MKILLLYLKEKLSTFDQKLNENRRNLYGIIDNI